MQTISTLEQQVLRYAIDKQTLYYSHITTACVMTFQNLQELRLIMATHNLNQHNDNSDRRHFSNSRYI